MIVKIKRDFGSLFVEDDNGFAVNAFDCANKVRTLANGLRKTHEVVCSIPSNKPYDPIQFPVGTWEVTGIQWDGFNRDTYGACKIRTDAYAMVHVWSLDHDGDYYKETDEVVKDTGYLIHAGKSVYTWGCIHMTDRDVTALGRILKVGDTIIVE